jgi:hypothetical protein
MRDGEIPDRSQGVPLLSVVAYVAVFTCIALPWLRAFTWALPTSALGFVSDMRLIVWVLSWVSHALGTEPTRLFDGPINYPAPGQITGCEHFASSQIAFAPVFWATGNGVLAANWTALATYPVAALAMERLVSVLGGSGLAAWLAGLVFALGPLRVPANLQILQYQNLYLPLLYVALIRLREQPGRGRAAMLALVLGLGVFSSYYMAVMLAVTGALLGVLEMAQPRPGRVRFASQALGAAAVPLALLTAFSIPYLRRPESSDLLRQAMSAQGAAVTILWSKLPDWATLLGGVSLCLAALGIPALGRGGTSPSRRMARAGLLLAVAGGILALGSSLEVSGWRLPLPFAVIEGSHALFFRAPLRFIVVMGFGLALLGAAGFDHLTRGFRGGVRLACFAVAVGAVLGGRGLEFTGAGMSPLESHPDAARVFEEVRAFVQAHGDGPLLELPAFDRLSLRDSEAMVHATRHGLPLVGGYTGYHAAHRAFLVAAVARLPRADALADLIDATHLRWLLLAPAPSWRTPAARAEFLRRIDESSMTRGVRWQGDGWTLVQVAREPRHQQWFRAIADGYRPGSTVLGTPIVPLPAAAAIARLSVARSTLAVWSGWPLRLEIGVTNAGSTAWPVSVPAYASQEHVVRLVGLWHAVAGESAPLPPQYLPLPRDVDPGETIAVEAMLVAPTRLGEYDLEIRVQQVDGPEFTAPGNLPLRRRVSVIRLPGGAR